MVLDAFAAVDRRQGKTTCSADIRPTPTQMFDGIQFQLAFGDTTMTSWSCQACGAGAAPPYVRRLLRRGRRPAMCFLLRRLCRWTRRSPAESEPIPPGYSCQSENHHHRRGRRRHVGSHPAAPPRRVGRDHRPGTQRLRLPSQTAASPTTWGRHREAGRPAPCRTPGSLKRRFGIDVRVRHEVTAIDPAAREVLGHRPAHRRAQHAAG